jgi:hypothetical protein
VAVPRALNCGYPSGGYPVAFARAIGRFVLPSSTIAGGKRWRFATRRLGEARGLPRFAPSANRAYPLPITGGIVGARAPGLV